MKSGACPFCTELIRDAEFAVSANFRAVYNIAPILPGHSLIIPRRHITSLLSLSDAELAELAIFSKAVTEILLREFKTDSFNWSVQDNEKAGQTVPHLHRHIVLRYRDDFPDPGDWYPEVEKNTSEILDSQSRKKLSSSEMRKIVDRLRIAASNKNLYRRG